MDFHASCRLSSLDWENGKSGLLVLACEGGELPLFATNRKLTLDEQGTEPAGGRNVSAGSGKKHREDRSDGCPVQSCRPREVIARDRAGRSTAADKAIPILAPTPGTTMPEETIDPGLL